MKKAVKPALVEERAFPFECSTSYGVEDGYRCLHWHQEMEICYIKHGTGKYLINGIDHSFSAGDIILINNDEIHLCHDDEELEMMVIMFEPNFLQSGSANPFDYEYLRPFLERSDSFCNKLSGESTYSSELAGVLLEIEREYESMENGYDLMIKSLLLKFLTLIIRYFLSRPSAARKVSLSSQTAEKIQQVITYISTSYYEEISLKSLSERFGISVPYLCSTFKSFTGSSPIDFLIKRRILEAKQMLSESDKSIVSVSEECGFKSLSNFNHLFRDVVGCSPSDYRRM